VSIGDRPLIRAGLLLRMVKLTDVKATARRRHVRTPQATVFRMPSASARQHIFGDTREGQDFAPEATEKPPARVRC
jgi:hypothetical protein